ncbi:MAG: hypothetical protein EPN93_15110 [Spirochaetes bacterium]|nr:MAG: hypothetical protein EPN93_15110 [Spirochaetota bacterium]
MRSLPSRTAGILTAGFISLIILGGAARPALAQKDIQTHRDADLKGKVIVYHFQNTGKSTEFGYYSYIIPENIATDIKRSDKFTVQTFPVVMEYVDQSAPAEQQKNRIRLLADRGREFDAQYVITGSFSVEGRIIRIRTQIFDVHELKMRDISETTEELGALLLVIIDQISTRINTELQKDIEIKKVHATASPFLPFYERIKGATLGLTHGQADISGDWGDIYDGKATMMSLSFAYDLSYFTNQPIYRDLTGSLQFDYMSVSNEDGGSGGNNNYLTIRTAGFACGYNYVLSPAFSATATVGLGGAWSTLEITDTGSNGPPAIIHTAKTVDPYLSLAAGLKFQFSHLQITTGLSWRTIFYSDVFMNMTVLYFGFGFML